MQVIDLATEKVIAAPGRTSVQMAARQMRDSHVGDIVVLEDGGAKPIGIVTDRDIVISVTALGLDPATLTLADIMNPQLYTAVATKDPDAVMEDMRRLGIRRAPVVNATGALCGMFTLDDYLDLLARRLVMIHGLLRNERQHEVQSRLALT